MTSVFEKIENIRQNKLLGKLFLKVKVAQSCLTPGQNTGEGSLSLHQRIFPTQESNPGLRIACGFFTS